MNVKVCVYSFFPHCCSSGSAVAVPVATQQVGNQILGSLSAAMPLPWPLAPQPCVTVMGPLPSLEDVFACQLASFFHKMQLPLLHPNLSKAA